MNLLLSLLLIQINKVKIHAYSLCERHLVAQDPNEERETQEEIRRLRLLSPEYFRGEK